MQNKIRIFFILLSNLFPAYGLFYLGWSPFNTVLVFLAETLLMFVSFQARMLVRLINKQWAALLPMVMSPPVLTFSYIHLSLSTLFMAPGTSIQYGEMLYIIYSGILAVSTGIIIMSIEHIIEFIYFIKNKEYEKHLSENNQDGMDKLFIRIFIMQLTVIFGLFIAKLTHNVKLGVSVLIVLQTIYSVYSFFKQRKTRAFILHPPTNRLGQASK